MILPAVSGFAFDVGYLVMLRAGLPSSVRLASPQRCSPFEAGALPVLRPARRIHIRLRGRVLCNPPRLKGFRPAVGDEASRAWHLWSSSSRSVAPRPRSRSPRRLSRRLHGVTRRNASSAEYRLLALRRVPPRIRRTEPPRVAQLATRHAAPLPHYMLNPFKPPQQLLTNTYRAITLKTLYDSIRQQL